jgi:hypothetical protein
MCAGFLAPTGEYPQVKTQIGRHPLLKTPPDLAVGTTGFEPATP